MWKDYKNERETRHTILERNGRSLRELNEENSINAEIFETFSCSLAAELNWTSSDTQIIMVKKRGGSEYKMQNGKNVKQAVGRWVDKERKQINRRIDDGKEIETRKAHSAFRWGRSPFNEQDYSLFREKGNGKNGFDFKKLHSIYRRAEIERDD